MRDNGITSAGAVCGPLALLTCMSLQSCPEMPHQGTHGACCCMQLFITYADRHYLVLEYPRSTSEMLHRHAGEARHPDSRRAAA